MPWICLRMLCFLSLNSHECEKECENSRLYICIPKCLHLTAGYFTVVTKGDNYLSSKYDTDSRYIIQFHWINVILIHMKRSYFIPWHKCLALFLVSGCPIFVIRQNNLQGAIIWSVRQIWCNAQPKFVIGFCSVGRQLPLLCLITKVSCAHGNVLLTMTVLIRPGVGLHFAQLRRIKVRWLYIVQEFI